MVAYLSTLAKVTAAAISTSLTAITSSLTSFSAFKAAIFLSLFLFKAAIFFRKRFSSFVAGRAGGSALLRKSGLLRRLVPVLVGRCSF